MALQMPRLGDKMEIEFEKTIQYYSGKRSRVHIVRCIHLICLAGEDIVFNFAGHARSTAARRVGKLCSNSARCSRAPELQSSAPCLLID